MASYTSTMILTLLLTVIPCNTLAPMNSVACAGSILLLAPCAPFVQGEAPIPVDTCCDNILNVYRNQPNCLCLILDHLASLPVNQSLVLQLPLGCHLNLTAGTETCPALSVPPIGSPPHASTEIGAGSASTGSPPFPMKKPTSEDYLYTWWKNSAMGLRPGTTSFALAILGVILRGILSLD